MAMKIPNKLKDDAITESTLEIRFDSPVTQEIAIARLCDNVPWGTYKLSRLPLSELPHSVRLQDPNLKYQPLLQYRNSDGPESVKVGTNVIMIHLIETYLGWEIFSSNISNLVKILIDRIQPISIVRIGLRYVNALTSSRHFVNDIRDLNLKILVADESVEANSNLIYQKKIGEFHAVMSRIISPAFIMSDKSDGISALVDIDVASTNAVTAIDHNFDSIMDWIQNAHVYEKEAFFKLLPVRVIDKLKES